MSVGELTPQPGSAALVLGSWPCPGNLAMLRCGIILFYFILFYFFFFFAISWAAPRAYGCSQARGR